MNLNEIKQKLEEHFDKEPNEGKNRHIVFWYDGDGEFVEDIDDISLDNVKTIKLTSNNTFHIKYLLEKKDVESNYLLYSPLPQPDFRDNWLLDILKYSVEFSADRASLIMQDFGVKEPALRGVFKKYLKFFGNKERYRKFALLHIDDFTEESIDIGVLSVLCRVRVANFEQVLKNILSGEIGVKNRYIEAIKSFGDMDAFWGLVEKRYGYIDEEKSLDSLLAMLLVSHLSYSLEEKIPEPWKDYVSFKKADAVVFISNFMNHTTDGKVFDALADKIEAALDVVGYLDKWDMEKYIGCDTFRAFDRKILNRLTANLLEGIGEFDRYRKIINKRRKSHWFDTYSNEYEALYYALQFLEMEGSMGGVVIDGTARELMERYAGEYYLLDYFYRKFYSFYDRIAEKESFTELAEKVENTYTRWYLNELSVKWSAAVEGELLDNYVLGWISQQKDFFRDLVAPFISRGERIFVIISDGLRYEAGKELAELIDREVRGATKVEFLQGVVPSTTKFGMASLLPWKKIRLDEKADVLIDGISTQGTKNRARILASYCKDALAISFRDMVDMKRDDYRKTFEGRRLIYIYHNAVDAVGDEPLTEREVFYAVEKAFEELVLLVKNLVNHVSAANIIITADHGFVYRRSPLLEVDKIAKHHLGAVDSGRRYMLAKTSEDLADTLPISMSYLLGKGTKFKAVVPKGVIRYKVEGAGANYAHGGASLQEIIVPVIKFKHIRKDEFKAGKVEVKLTNITRKITNRVTYLEFFQAEKVGDKRVPLRLSLYFADGDGNRISNENIIIADSKSNNPLDRTHREKFTLKDIPYDISKRYYLILEDEEESAKKIYEKVPFTIDILPQDDPPFSP